MDRNSSATLRMPLGALRCFELALALAVVTSASLVVTPRHAQAQATPSSGQQVVLVTGSTSGLGREVALRLGAMGFHVIVHGRNAERGGQVVDEINNTGPGSARFYGADLASFAQVRSFGESILRDYQRLDVLVNNAGGDFSPRFST